MKRRLLKYGAACGLAEAVALIWTPPPLRAIVGTIWGLSLLGMAWVVWQTAAPAPPAYLDDPEYDGIVFPGGNWE